MGLVALVFPLALVVFGMTLGFCAIQGGNDLWMLALVPIGVFAGAAWLKNLFPLTAVAVSSLAGVFGGPIATTFC